MFKFLFYFISKTTLEDPSRTRRGLIDYIGEATIIAVFISCVLGIGLLLAVTFYNIFVDSLYVLDTTQNIIKESLPYYIIFLLYEILIFVIISIEYEKTPVVSKMIIQNLTESGTLNKCRTIQDFFQVVRHIYHGRNLSLSYGVNERIIIFRIESINDEGKVDIIHYHLDFNRVSSSGIFMFLWLFRNGFILKHAKWYISDCYDGRSEYKFIITFPLFDLHKQVLSDNYYLYNPKKSKFSNKVDKYI